MERAKKRPAKQLDSVEVMKPFDGRGWMKILEYEQEAMIVHA